MTAPSSENPIVRHAWVVLTALGDPRRAHVDAVLAGFGVTTAEARASWWRRRCAWLDGKRPEQVFATDPRRVLGAVTGALLASVDQLRAMDGGATAPTVAGWLRAADAPAILIETVERIGRGERPLEAHYG